jgi:hypothetical protein
MILRHRIFSVLALWLSMALPAGAQGLPALKTEQPAPAKALVGQRVVFHVDLQAKGEFSGSPRFVLPDVPGILLMQSEDHPVLSSTTAGDDGYVIERFDFIVFAKEAGTVTIPSIKVSFGSIATIGQQVTTQSGETDPIILQVSLPPDATAAAAPMPIVSSHFEAAQSWQPQPAGAGPTCKVGDAFRRTIRLTAQDSLSMLLPSLKMPAIDGLKTYLAAPQLTDSSERGDAIATRIETVTYICTSPGRSLIPAISYRWWNIDTNSWEKVVLPAVRLMVKAAGAAGNGTGADRHAKLQWLLPALAAVILLVAMLCIWGWRRRHQPFPDGDESHFSRLLIACRESDPTAAYNAYVNWSLTPNRKPRSEVLVDNLDTDIKRDLQHVQECLLSGTPWDGRQLAHSLKAWHRAARRMHAGRQLLPQLN